MLVDDVEAVDHLVAERLHLGVPDVELQVVERARDPVEHADRVLGAHFDDRRVVATRRCATSPRRDRARRRRRCEARVVVAGPVGEPRLEREPAVEHLHHVAREPLPVGLVAVRRAARGTRRPRRARRRDSTARRRRARRGPAARARPLSWQNSPGRSGATTTTRRRRSPCTSTLARASSTSAWSSAVRARRPSARVARPRARRRRAATSSAINAAFQSDHALSPVALESASVSAASSSSVCDDRPLRRRRASSVAGSLDVAPRRRVGEEQVVAHEADEHVDVGRRESPCAVAMRCMSSTPTSV